MAPRDQHGGAEDASPVPSACDGGGHGRQARSPALRSRPLGRRSWLVALLLIGAYSLATEECLALCDHAPCVLINEKKHSRVRPEDVPALLADPNNDKLDVPRSDLYDPVHEERSPAQPGQAPARRHEGGDPGR